MINKDMARHGILLFTFGLLLLAVKQVSETSTWELIPLSKLIPTPPVYFSTPLRITLIVISLIFMFVILRMWKKWQLNKVACWVILSLLLLFVLWLIPPIPVFSFTILGKIAVLASIAFMVAVFWDWLASKLKNFLEGQFQSSYWTIFCLVYICGWLKGLSSVPTDGFAFHIAYWIGFVWFSIITIIMLRAAWQTGRRK